MEKYKTEFKFKVVKSFLAGEGGAKLLEQAPQHCHMERRLQRDQIVQRLRAHAACDLCRFESPINWRFKA